MHVVEGMFGGRTVKTVSPAPLLPWHPAVTERFQFPRISASFSFKNRTASLVGCLFW